jgi:hypothetical protein
MGYIIEEMNFDIKAGTTGIPTLIIALIIIVITFYKAIRILKSNDCRNIGLSGIWLFGLFAFLLRIFEQVLGLGNLFYAIGIAEIPDYQALALGLSEILLKSVLGFIVLILSLVFWGILHGLIILKTKRKLGI